MSLRIATNISAIAGQRYLNQNKLMLDQALNRLSSGNRINRAGDDAAGLAISEKLKAQVRSLKQANRNANDGISLIQTAEGALNEVSNILIRLRELSIQGASDTVGATERQYIDKEVQSLKKEVDRITLSTEFNGAKLLSGQVDTLDFQVGANNDTLSRLEFDTKNLETSLESLGIADVASTDKLSAQENLSKLDVAINRVNANRAELGALQNRLGSTINNLSIYTENLAAANSRIRDTDVAEESSELVKQNILTQSNIAMLAQANATPNMALQLLQ